MAGNFRTRRGVDEKKQPLPGDVLAAAGESSSLDDAAGLSSDSGILLLSGKRCQWQASVSAVSVVVGI